MVALPFRMHFVALAAGLAAVACSRGDAPPPANASVAAAAPAAAGLTPFELEHGVGPVKSELALEPLDQALAERGEQIFEMKCSACHKMADRYVGPPLGDVLQRRSPAYVMNMILNPDAMYTRHPEAKKLLAEYLTPMPNQGLSQDEARAVIEYLRAVAAASGDHTS